MSENSSDEDEITPVFAFRADNIMQKQREAYEEMLKKMEEEDTAKTVKNEEEELLVKIHEKLKKKPSRGKGKTNVKTCSKETEEKSLPERRSTRLRKNLPENKSTLNIVPTIEESPINLPAKTKQKLKRESLKNKKERERIRELNKRVLSSCFSSTVDDQCMDIDDETIQNITLKISYLSDISKLTVGEKEKFSSIASKVADLLKLKANELKLFLRDEIISLDDTPDSLKMKSWDIIDCIPYKATDKMEDGTDSNKILIKMQSSDSRKKIDVYAHKLEKFQDIMQRYANLRSLPLKDLIFEFDGEKISGSDTPDDLEMESESCVDVKVGGTSLKPASPILFVDLENEEPPHKMLNICVLD